MGTVLKDRRAVIHDRHPLWLEALDQLLNRAGMEVVGRTTSRREAIRLVEAHRPDVFVMEVAGAADGAGFECLRRAHAANADMKAIVISDQDDMAAVEAAFAEGASAFCKKSAAPDDLAAAIRQSFATSIYLARSRAGAQASANGGWLTGNGHPELTRRELEILRLVAEGHSNAQLAQMLWVTEQTVKFHLSNCYRKLNVSNRTEASRWAQLNGLLPPTQGRPALA